MDNALTDLVISYGLIGFVAAAVVATVAVLPWRPADLRASAVAWENLSLISGSVARSGFLALRNGVVRVRDVARRPSPVMTRTLS